MYTTHNTRDCRRFEKDGKEKSNFCAVKKGGKKGHPVNHNFVQLAKKIKKLEKALKKSEKDGKEKSNFCAAKKDGKKANPVNQIFAQLTKKIKKLEKTLKKSGKKGQKHHYEDSDSDSK
jgi:hypothetical protein